VLRGAGGHFCAGADLKDIAAARAANADALAETNARFGAFLQKRKPNWAPQ
jgi:isohexenylglutaconyl-CoA hydratase